MAVSKKFCVFCKNYECAIRYGRQKNGVRRFRCMSNGRIFNERCNTPLYRSRLSKNKVNLLSKNFEEGVALLIISRVCGVSEKTARSFFKKCSAHLKKVNDVLVRRANIKALEFDEVHYKSQEEDDGYFWIGYDPVNKVFVGNEIGKRDKKSLRLLFNSLNFLKEKICLILVDGYKGFKKVINEFFTNKYLLIGIFNKNSKNFKRYGADGMSREEVEKRIKELGLGSIINTSHIEAFNRTIRLLIPYFVRKTPRVARLKENVKTSVNFYQGHHNICKPHTTLSEKAEKPTTPLMSAGVTKKPFTLKEIIKIPLHIAKEKLTT